jgi:hypothetical protein
MANELDTLSQTVDLFLQSKGQTSVGGLAFSIGKMVYSYVTTLKQKQFNRKLLRFLKETGNATDKERINFLRRLGKNKSKFFDSVLLLIEDLNEERKATIVGKLCHALILKQITVEQFHRASLTLKNTLVTDLYVLRRDIIRREKPFEKVDTFTQNGSKREAYDNLINTGLYKLTDNNYTIIGGILVKYGF